MNVGIHTNHLNHKTLTGLNLTKTDYLVIQHFLLLDLAIPKEQTFSLNVRPWFPMPARVTQ